MTFEALQADLRDGRWGSGEPFMTIAEVCDRFDVSAITARRVLRELATAGLIVPRGRQAAIVADQAGPADVFVCLPTLSSHHDYAVFYSTFELLMRGFYHEAYRRIYLPKIISLDFCLAHPKQFRDARLLVSGDALMDRQDDGSFRFNKDRLAAIRKLAEPIVFHGLPVMRGVTMVAFDFKAAISKAVRHLVEKGHRRIAWLAGQSTNPWMQPRYEGYFEGLHEAGMSIDPQLIAVTDGFVARESHDAMRRWAKLASPPTAVICANEYRALHVLDHCRRQRIGVPGEMGIISFGGLHEVELSKPAITSLSNVNEQLGCRAMQLLSRLDGGTLKRHEAHYIEPELIVRQTT